MSKMMAVCWWFGTLAECREPEKCTGCVAKVMPAPAPAPAKGTK